MTMLDRQSLDFARQHIRCYYDSDFLPKAFEFQSLWEDWDNICDFLTSRPIEELPAHPPKLITAPKPGFGYRVIHQLDPICTIIYTALVYNVAEGIETARPCMNKRVACAYRVKINSTKGSFFADNTGYVDFINQCRDLSSNNTWVLSTDISDFYNQIYLHRLQNNIANANSGLGTWSTTIEDYLMSFNGGGSKGIPVGPAASIIMAEATLLDVDAFIASQGFRHTRYVDDIRVFSDSQQRLDDLYQRLIIYLYDNHRLTLAGHKSRLLASSDFILEFLDSPESLEKEANHNDIKQITTWADAYAIREDKEHLLDDNKPSISVIKYLMEKLCSLNKLDLGLSRHLLRRCREYRIRAIVPYLLKHFDLFSPVAPHVFLYLHKVTNATFIEKNIEAFSSLYSTDAAKSEFVRIWMDGYFAKHVGFLRNDRIATEVRNSPCMSAQATAAITLSDLSWVRQHKAHIDRLSSYDRRCVLKASLVMPKAERSAWLNKINRNYNQVTDQALIRWLYQQ